MTLHEALAKRASTGAWGVQSLRGAAIYHKVKLDCTDIYWTVDELGNEIVANMSAADYAQNSWSVVQVAPAQ